MSTWIVENTTRKQRKYWAKWTDKPAMSFKAVSYINAK